MLERLAHLAATRPQAVLLRGVGADVTFAQCHDTALRAGAWLRSLGVERGDRVLLLAGNCPLFLYLWWGAMAAGAIPVPVHPDATGESLGHVLADSGARLVTSDRDLSALRAAADPQGRCRFEALDETGLHGRLGGFPPLASEPMAPAAIASILYTSGTTGRPKGAMITNASYLAAGRCISEGIGITQEDRVMVFLPLSHANPQMYAVMSALATGCSLVLSPRFSASAFAQTAVRHGATGFTYVGTVLNILARHFGDAAQQTPLRWCVGGGAPRAVWEHIERVLGVTVHELYGMTETGGVATMNTRANRRVGSIGKARDDMELAILDANDRRLPANAVGEIAIRPREPFVLMAGYYQRPEELVRISSNFWLHTGDLGRQDDDGFFHFEGRSKDLIRRAGEMISPVEIELAALGCAGVSDCAAVGVPDEILEEEIKLVVVPGEGFSAEALVAHLKPRLPGYMMPRILEQVPAIPRTGTEKIQRFHLRAPRGIISDLKPLLSSPGASSCKIQPVTGE